MKKSHLSIPSTFFIIKKVGDIKECISTITKSGKSRKTSILYSYNDVEYDANGWADSSKYLPEDFDIVYMKLRRDKIIPGWINGIHWDGLRLKPNDKVIFWKKENQENE